ncbi:uncharacterized protein A1O5_10055 [Cladophialophora psammophila CBS 110553]|uniref:Uncharacterized protein n=1 Tax=Cladophialophora psammophila CBS 110553 TaxID=1182543 RepID=W9WPG9_9EURO|nr:uncharacterized protein A1O5_10055 [Cladophialophora psammophila CBS 110553]EXJ66860.1 hypothetical protein A1O5_10055 [Cladophialophora psammophila CBS 110553]
MLPIFGGNTPGASLWDFNGGAIGFTDGTSKILPQGNFVDITVNPNAEAGNIQAAYVSITNGGKDAVCIAGLALTFPDGGRAGFSTNVAAACGAFWSNSNTPVLQQQATGEIENPKCVWIDRDGSNGIPYQGFGIHLPSFSNSNKNLGASYSDNRDLMCKSGPRFRMYPQLITEESILVFPHPPEFITDSDDPSLIGTDKDPGFIIENPGVAGGNLISGLLSGILRRRDVIRRYHQHGPALSTSTIGSDGSSGTQAPPRRPLAELLIISPHEFNSARELCESWNSFGHSFVSLPESLFCDMTDKSLYYTCSDKVMSCCLDTDQASFRACQKTSTRPPVTQVNGTSVLPSTLRTRQANSGLDSSWMKGDMVYDSVQRW